eukprot:TRINITY_DN5719_c0_g1_i1.p1 TRINITY_DN5719_c0_g1~~TRINITY_DN5719_c0_g1_i1.p1  ORF type:complete len:320 (-),score=87.66 TRINITY_DN5719_c0_g1_i1:83-1042(-)
MKILLPMVAYKFSNGPWRTFWTRLGYDPRKIPESRIYQIIDYRTRKKEDFYEDNFVHQTPIRKHSDQSFTIATETSSTVSQSSSHQGPRLVAVNVTMSSVRKSKEEYSFAVLPTRYQKNYQLCDLCDEEIQKEIEESEPTEVCDIQQSGWFSKATLGRIRRLLQQRHVRLLRETGGDETLIEELEMKGKKKPKKRRYPTPQTTNPIIGRKKRQKLKRKQKRRPKLQIRYEGDEAKSSEGQEEEEEEEEEDEYEDEDEDEDEEEYEYEDETNEEGNAQMPPLEPISATSKGKDEVEEEEYEDEDVDEDEPFAILGDEDSD